MLRVHFTEEDFGRLQLSAPDPLWETVLGLHQLTAPAPPPPVFSSWRKRARMVVDQERLSAPVRILSGIAPHDAVLFPDFLTPTTPSPALAVQLDMVRATAPAQVARELSLIARTRTLPAWCHRLARGRRERLDDVADALRVLHQAIIAPEWTWTRSCVEDDRRRHLDAWHGGGGQALLNSLPAPLRWRPPVLESDYPVPYDIRLRGRGLRLVPSYFCWGRPVAFMDPDLPPTLVYPVDHGTHWAHSALTALLGRTRARVLAALAEPATTAGIARRLGIALASASEHAKVLREANLATSRRIGGSVLHSLTPLGDAVLHGTLPPEKREPGP